MTEIEQIRKSNHRIPGKISKGFIIEGNFDYPLFFPLIFSFFSKKTLLKIQGFISPFFDSIQNFLVFLIAFSLTGDINFSLISQIIYSLTPMIAVENSNLTPRSFGYLNFTLAFYPLLAYNLNHQIFFLIIGIIFTSCLFLSHRFALQSFLFISLFFTIVDKSTIYIVSLIIGFFLTTTLTKGYYLRVAKGHLSNIYFWIINYKYRFAHQIYGNKKQLKKDWVGKIYFLLSYLSPIFIIAINFWIVSAFIYAFLVFKNIFPVINNIYYKMSLWVIFFYIVGALVLKIKRLIPIGEGQRYMEMSTVPASILSAFIFTYFYKIYGIFAVYVFITLIAINLGMIVFIQFKGIISDKNRSLTDDLINVFKFINKLPNTPRIMCIPHQITTMTVYNTKADVLVNADNSGLMKITDFYPILKVPIMELSKKYKLDYLILRENFAKLNEIKLKNPKVIFKSGDILLIKLLSNG